MCDGFFARVATVTCQDMELVIVDYMASKELLVLVMLSREEEAEGDSKQAIRSWARHWVLERNKKGCFYQLLPRLAAAHDTLAFEKLLRMHLSHFEKIVGYGFGNW